MNKKILFTGIVIMGIAMILNVMTTEQFEFCMKSHEASGVGLVYLGDKCPISVIVYSIGSVAVVIGIIVAIIGLVKKQSKKQEKK